MHGKNISFFLRGYDVDGDNITYKIKKSPDFGNYSIKNNKVTYFPNKDSFGVKDVLTYYVEDETGDTSSLAKVTINITNNRPTGVDETYSMKKAEESLKVELKGYDEDRSDAVELSYIVERNPSFGTFKRVRNSRNVFEYTPNDDFEGPDQLAYVIYDGVQYSEVNIITINVIGENVVMSKTQSPKQKDRNTQNTSTTNKKTSNKDDGGSNMTLILVLLLVVILAAAGGGGGGGSSDPTGGVDIGITIP